MPIQVQGATGTVAEVGGTTFRALSIQSKPAEYGALGHYQVAAGTGPMSAALAGNSEILQFRWTDATRLAVVTKIRVEGMITTTAFAAGPIFLGAHMARGWSADGSGGAAITMTGNNQKQRTSMGTSLVGAIRVATTGALTAGTKTLDVQPFGSIVSHSSAGTGSATPIIGSIYLPQNELVDTDSGDGEHPIVLASNEGFVVRAIVPITGVWNLSIRCKWSEVTAY